MTLQSLSAKAQARIDLALTRRLCVDCLQPLKPNEKPDRGCHHACAKRTRRAIERGDYTESDRIAAGKILPPQITGRPLSNPSSIEMELNRRVSRIKPKRSRAK